MPSYQDEKIAKEYYAFTNSENGQIQQEILFKAIKKHLPDNINAAILDAGCGGGWLAKKISATHGNIFGCDFSEPLLNIAKKESPAVKFAMGDLNAALPYQDYTFDAIILNMVLHDVKNISNAFSEVFRVLKPGGTLIVTIANPYYSFPVGVWKRGIVGFLLRRMPKLKLRAFFHFKRNSREFNWNDRFTSYFYPLSEQFSTALGQGFQLTAYEDLEATSDSTTFNLNYQLHRFPTILLFAFKKPAK